MIIQRTATTLVVKDRPGAFWLLGIILAVGGFLALAAASGLVQSSEPLGPGLRFLLAIAGITVLTGAAWWLKRSPGTRAEVNLARGKLTIVRTGLGAREVHRLRLADVQAFDVERSEDDEGGVVVRPRVRLCSAESIALSMLWSHDPIGVADTVARLGQFCGLDPAVPVDAAHTGTAHTGTA